MLPCRVLLAEQAANDYRQVYYEGTSLHRFCLCRSVQKHHELRKRIAPDVFQLVPSVDQSIY